MQFRKEFVFGHNPQQSCGTEQEGAKLSPQFIQNLSRFTVHLAVIVCVSVSQNEKKQQKIGGRFNSFCLKGFNPPPHIAPSQRGGTCQDENS